MRRLLPTCLCALGLAVGVGAQESTIKSETTVQADDAKAVTVTGCVTGGPSSYSLTNVAMAKPSPDRSSEVGAVGTSGTVASYDLSTRDGVDLTGHVGHKVEITGVILSAAKDGDDDAEIEIESETETDIDDAPDEKVESETEVEVARGVAPKLAVTSVKMVSSTCVP